MPNAPRTPIRNLRVPDEEWHPAQQRAAALGETLTSAMRRFLVAYAAGEPFTLPPPPDEPR